MRTTRVMERAMFETANFALGQSWAAAGNAWRLAVESEARGDLVAAAHWWEQTDAAIIQWMAQARFVPDAVHFNRAIANFNAARLKALLGWSAASWGHLQSSLFAVNEAIRLNPGLAAYHSWAASVLCAQGNFAEARRALGVALQLSPGDPYAHHMLAMMNAQSQTLAAPAPAEPTESQASPRPSGHEDLPGKIKPWVDMFVSVAELANKFNAFGGATQPQPNYTGFGGWGANPGW